MGDGVKGDDGRNRDVDLAFEFTQDLGGSRLAERLDLRVLHAQDHRFRDRAEERDRERTEDGENEDQHRRSARSLEREPSVAEWRGARERERLSALKPANFG